jgi:hypothetical protein
MGPDDYKQCAHTGCTCSIPAKQEYCSPYCRQQSEGSGKQQSQSMESPQPQASPGCGCGHAACHSGQ